MTIDFKKYLQSLTDPSKAPGMNINSNVTVSKAKQEGVKAQKQEAIDKREKEKRIKNRMEMKPTLIKKASFAEKLRGSKDTYKLVPLVIGMSGADPAGEFVVAGAALNPIFKLAGDGLLYGAAKYLKGSNYQNWARAKLLNRELRNPLIPSKELATNQFEELINPSKAIIKIGDLEIYPDRFYHESSLASDDFLLRPNNDRWFSKGKLFYKTNDDVIELKNNSKVSILGNGEYKQNGNLKNKDVSLYKYEPGYGYRAVDLNLPIKLLKSGLISLKFFERPLSKISEAERVGIPKGERNLPFKPKQPTEHVQGEEAIKMFKEYGGISIPEGSINGEQLRKYVAEARERYGLVGNNNITDEEIALALYKHSKELGGNTAAINALGEPQLLFRGDTRRYTQLKERMSPEELATKSGTMDNSLGNLFLGEFPDSWRGVDRYIGTWRNFNGYPKLIGSGTGSKVVWDGKIASEIEGYPYLGPLAGGGYKLYSQPHRYGYIDVYKLPASMMESGVNDLNAFIVRTPQMRNASSEISVLNDDWMLQGAKDSHFMSRNYKYNPKTYSMENVKTGKSLGEITTESAPESRVAMGDHYKELLKEAEQKQLGLLKSEANAPLRDEHSLYSYFALPNFNIRGAKHLLPYDLRIPRNWKDPNIYRSMAPYVIGGSTLYGISSLKQGSKLNLLKKIKNENNL